MSLFTHSLAVLACLSATSIATVSKAYARCTPPRMMMILDKSSSMQTGSIAGMSKWDIAVNAIDNMSREFENQVEIGLSIFPAPNQCSPGETKVAPRLRSHNEIMSALAAAPPRTGNWTPMAQSLEAVANDPSMREDTMPRYAVLITDGWQWCFPYESSTRFDPAQAVASLNGIGVTTYVVGFGGSVDALTLNQVAVTAGTTRAGCDPTGSNPSSPNPCYYQADDLSELSAALSLIAGEVSGTEICDGEDNNCDGDVDENLVRACASDCGSGTSTCIKGRWTSCNAPAPKKEICDGIDNDCDGSKDLGCQCLEGETQECGSDEACTKGIQECGQDGTWGACQGAIEPSEEMCDGKDNNCNDIVDESVDEVVGLCDLGFVCKKGECQEIAPQAPTEDEPSSPVLDGSPSGCGCQTNSGSESTSLLLLLGMLLVFRRKEKNTAL